MLHIKFKRITNAATCSNDLPGCHHGVKIHLFQNMVMLHIKLMGMTNAATWWQIFCPQTPTIHTRPWGEVKRSTFNFSENSHLSYQMKWNHKCSNMVGFFLPPETPLPTSLHRTWVSRGQNSTFLKHCHVAYKIKGTHKYCNMITNVFPKTPSTQTLG